MKKIQLNNALEELDAAEKEVSDAQIELSEIRQKFTPLLKAAEIKVSIAQSKLSALISIVRTLNKK